MRGATTTMRAGAVGALALALLAAGCDVLLPSAARPPTIWGHVTLDGKMGALPQHRRQAWGRRHNRGRAGCASHGHHCGPGVVLGCGGARRRAGLSLHDHPGRGSGASDNLSAAVAMKRCKVALALALAGSTTACQHGIGDRNRVWPDEDDQ